jgi:hypothetical protein
VLCNCLSYPALCFCTPPLHARRSDLKPVPQVTAFCGCQTHTPTASDGFKRAAIKRFFGVRARRSVVDHPPGTGKAPGSNPGESIGATEFYERARMVETGFESRKRERSERLPSGSNPGESIRLTSFDSFPRRPSQTLRVCSVPASPFLIGSFTPCDETPASPF